MLSLCLLACLAFLCWFVCAIVFIEFFFFFFFFSSRRRHTRSLRDWSSDVCSSDLKPPASECSEASDDYADEVPEFHESERDSNSNGGHCECRIAGSDSHHSSDQPDRKSVV